MKRIFISLLFLGLIAGCATKKPLYYWGNYSGSLYQYKKSPSEKTLVAYKATLLNIIDESKKMDLRVPPGVSCEYGYLLLQEGKNDEAIYYFDLEEKNYPESKQFIDRVRAKWLPKKEN